VGAVVCQEKLEAAGEKIGSTGAAAGRGVCVAGIAECSPDEHGRAVANVAGDQGVRQGIAANVGKRGVYRVTKIERRVNQGAVKIEDEEAREEIHSGKCKGPAQAYLRRTPSTLPWIETFAAGA
jgi:hypothetical protein